MRRPLALLALVPVLALVVACGSDDDAAGTHRSTTTTASDTGSDSGPLVDAKANIELTDPGAAPRRQILIDPPDGCEQRLTMTQEQDLTQSIEGTAGGDQTTSSGLQLDTLYKCTKVTKDRIDADLTYTDARVTKADGAASSEMRRLVDAFKGRTGHIVVDHHGHVLEMQQPKIGSVGDDQVDQAMDEMLSGLSDSVKDLSTPFPQEEIGVGARWVQSSEVEAAGFKMRQRIEYHLTELDDDHMTAEVSSTLEPVPGKVELPESLGDLGDAGDFDMRVESGKLTGTGTATWDLHGVASLIDQTVEGDIVMSVTAEGQRLELHQHQRQHQSLVPAGGG
jgi:hypothetical protein